MSEQTRKALIFDWPVLYIIYQIFREPFSIAILFRVVTLGSRVFRRKGTNEPVEGVHGSQRRPRVEVRSREVVNAASTSARIERR